jgi:(p)ppGpp synthase/HD superfamily hydrolase
MHEAHKKRLGTLRLLLQGKEYYNALKALSFAQRYHKGMRKDGVTPEFDHQVSIALYAWTLPNLIHREAVIAAILTHDIPEDYDVSVMEIGQLFDDAAFRVLVCNGVENVTKVFRGIVKPKDLLYAAMAADPVASIVKGCDRHHNFQSMPGVFSYEKQVSYVAEAEEDILPMLKLARDLHWPQVLAYENVKHVLRSQIGMVHAIHVAAGYPQTIAS